MEGKHDPGGTKVYPLQRDEGPGRIVFGGANDEYRYFIERLFVPDLVTKAPEKDGAVLFWLMNPAMAGPRFDDSTLHFGCFPPVATVLWDWAWM